MSVDLSALPIASASPRLVTFGGLLTPALGGPVQRIDRLGARWAWTFETAAMAIEPHGRIWAARLARATREGAVMRVSQPNLDIGSAGAPVVAAGAGPGRVLPIAGLTSGYSAREGQWLSIDHEGQRYLDQVIVGAVADGAGLASVTLQNLLRVMLIAGDAIDLAQPKIEGWLPDFTEWSLPRSRTTSFTFTIEEAA